jgi:hypothetical protein
VVENYLENHLIFEELNHYKDHKEILGKHPIFAWMQRARDIRGMKVGELVKLRDRLMNNLVINRKRIRTQKNHPQTASRVENVKRMEKELEEVNRLLNL